MDLDKVNLIFLDIDLDGNKKTNALFIYYRILICSFYTHEHIYVFLSLFFPLHAIELEKEKDTILAQFTSNLFAMIFRGKILWVGPKELIPKADGSTMTKISFVVEEQTDREYRDGILLDMYNDRAEMFANTYKEGDMVSVTFGGRVRDYTNREGATRKICSLTALRVDLEGNGNSNSRPAAKAADDADDDLPF